TDRWDTFVLLTGTDRGVRGVPITRTGAEKQVRVSATPTKGEIHVRKSSPTTTIILVPHPYPTRRERRTAPTRSFPRAPHFTPPPRLPRRHPRRQRDQGHRRKSLRERRRSGTHRPHQTGHPPPPAHRAAGHRPRRLRAERRRRIPRQHPRLRQG